MRHQRRLFFVNPAYVFSQQQGTLQIFDLASSSMTEEVAAHEKEVWSMHLTPDRRGFVTASGDKTVKFWQFELVNRTTEDHEGGETVPPLL